MVRLLSRAPIRWVLSVVLSLQVGIAVVVVAEDAVGLGSALDWAIPSPPLRNDPIAPGDQVRRYDPDSVPRPDRDRGGARPPAPFPLPAALGDMTFDLVETAEYGTVLTLFGGFGPGDSDRFERFIDAADPKPTAVALHSPGGRVAEALRIGRIVRARGLDTLVTADASCNSACPLVLFAGRDRIVSRHAWIGMHQIYLGDGALIPSREALIDVQTVQGEVIAYTDEMGVDPLVHVHALQTPPEMAYYLIEDELSDYRVATRVID